MNFTPEFIDNRNGNTLAEALARLLGGSVASGSHGPRNSRLAVVARAGNNEVLCSLNEGTSTGGGTGC